MKICFYIACFNRDLIIELKNEEEVVRAEAIMNEAYDRWCEKPDEVGDMCCEEYICDYLKAADVDFDWIEQEKNMEHEILERLKEAIEEEYGDLDNECGCYVNEKWLSIANIYRLIDGVDKDFD